MSAHEPTSTEAILDELRSVPALRQLFGGFGPLVLAAVLVLAMILLAPSVAPEQIIERPVETTDTGAPGTETTGAGGTGAEPGDGG